MHSAGIQDRDGAALLVASKPERRARLKHVWADSGYAGKGVRNLVAGNLGVEIVRRSGERTRGPWRLPQMPLFTAPAGFELVKRRWVVERTFAWLGRYRRLSKDYEATVWASEAWVWTASLRNLTRRLARS